MPQAAVPSDWKERLHGALIELGMPFTADAVEHSHVAESGGELQFVTPKEFSLSMNEKDIQRAIQQVAGRPMKLKIQIGEPQVASAPKADRKMPEDEVSQRALGHPEVQRFQEMFPGAQVRAVRNLKE